MADAIAMETAETPVPVSPTPQQLREDFTSEAFKIEIRNIANYGFGVSEVIACGHYKFLLFGTFRTCVINEILCVFQQEIKKFLKKKLELNPVKIKAQPGKRRDFAYLCFRNEAERTEALAKLDGYVWKNKTIEAKVRMLANIDLINGYLSHEIPPPRTACQSRAGSDGRQAKRDHRKHRRQ